jgi:hypothetical protein
MEYDHQAPSIDTQAMMKVIQFRMQQAEIAREILANLELSHTSLGDDARAVLARFMQSKITLTVGDL